MCAFWILEGPAPAGVSPQFGSRVLEIRAAPGVGSWGRYVGKRCRPRAPRWPAADRTAQAWARHEMVSRV